MITNQFTVGQSVIATLSDGDEIAGTIVETRPQFGIFIVQTETGSRLHVLEKRLRAALVHSWD